MTRMVDNYKSQTWLIAWLTDLGVNLTSLNVDLT